MTHRFAIAVCVAGVAILLAVLAPQAHITVRSPYTYRQDVAPILERRCADCHRSGGISWMPLEGYNEVRTLSWPIRQSLMAARMPPWFGESGLATLKEPSHALTARELDILMTWASGGAPEGPLDGSVASSGRAESTGTRAPDAVLEMPQPFVLEAGVSSADVEIVLPAGAVKGKWIRSFNVQAGTPAIVHHAMLLSKRRGVEQVIGVWIPGEPSLALEGGGAFYVPPDGELLLRIHYQRPFAPSAGISVDKSRVAIYFADSTGAREVKSIDLGPQPRALDRTVRALALRPIDGPPAARVTVTVVGPKGSSVLARVQFRPEWPQRYVFAEPVVLKRGSRIEMTIEPWNSSLWQTLTGGPRPPDQSKPLHVILEVLR